MLKNKLFLLVGLFATHSLSFAQTNGLVIDKIIAKVDNHIILKSELELGYLDMITRGISVDDNSKCGVLEGLVLNKLLLAKSEIDSISVLDFEVERSLDNKLRYFISQIGSEEKLEEYYGKSMEQFKDELRDQEKEQLLIQRMSESITEDVTITPGEVRRFFNRIPIDSLPFFSKEVVVGEIVMYPKAGQERKDQAKELLRALKERILSGESFNQLASQYSQEPAASRSGGELGFFRRGELAHEYEAAALYLQPGEISIPVETEFGIHLIQLLERRGNEYNSRHILRIPAPSQEDIQRTVNKMDSLWKMITLDSIKFEKAARDFSENKLTNINGGFMQDQTGSDRISVEQLDPNTFFTLDTMHVGSISPPIVYKDEAGKDAVRLVFFKNSIRPHRANLNDDWSKIRIAALNEKKQIVLDEWFEKSRFEVFIRIDAEYDNCNIMN
ncbi:MAG TPA: peptidylprolyl isomerase [Cyclobacteriaceae bacterium]